MGEVYNATGTNLKREVAVKGLHARPDPLVRQSVQELSLRPPGRRKERLASGASCI